VGEQKLNDKVLWLTPGTRSWGVDSGQEPPAAVALREPVWIRRHVEEDAMVAAATMAAIETDPMKRAGFSLIHEIRARVCHDLKIHGWLFDRVLRKMVEGALPHPNYAVHVDAGGGNQLLPSEEAFMIGDRAYYLVTLVRRAAP